MPPPTGRSSPRFTSAFAESTQDGPGEQVPTTVHLRLRGEHNVMSCDMIAVFGSPPPSRRAHLELGSRLRGIWFTSAFAESTSRAMASVSCLCGSPPPSRRARDAGVGVAVDPRFTSAFAESTNGADKTFFILPVHLRLRGEHVVADGRDDVAVGSPPPSRRALGAPQGASMSDRFTSAFAESTSGGRECGSVFTLHLRLRGEHDAGATPGEQADGSPPPSRRAHHRRRPAVRLQRFTSAFAESTQWLVLRAVVAAVHLRLRGEHAGMTSRWPG